MTKPRRVVADHPPSRTDRYTTFEGEDLDLSTIAGWVEEELNNAAEYPAAGHCALGPDGKWYRLDYEVLVHAELVTDPEHLRLLESARLDGMYTTDNEEVPE